MENITKEMLENSLEFYNLYGIFLREDYEFTEGIKIRHRRLINNENTFIKIENGETTEIDTDTFTELIKRHIKDTFMEGLFNDANMVCRECGREWKLKFGTLELDRKNRFCCSLAEFDADIICGVETYDMDGKLLKGAFD